MEPDEPGGGGRARSEESQRKGRGSSRAEAAELRRSLQSGEIPVCPRCNNPLSRRRIPPDSRVSYVRHRSWWTCSGCGFSAVVDDEDRR